MHRIRLRGPWSLASAEGPLIVRLPATWNEVAPHAELRTVTLSRAFQRPTGLTPAHRLELCLANALSANSETYVQSWSLNDHALPLLWHAADLICDVTDHVRATNVLTVQLTVPEPHPGNQPLPIELSLNIHEPLGDVDVAAT